MSHFAVLVFTKTGSQQELEDALWPYHEYECTGKKNQYVQEIDVLEEKRKEFEEEILTFVQYPDGSIIHNHDQRFYKKVKRDGERFESTVYEIPKGCKEVKLKASDLYTFEGWTLNSREFKSFIEDGAKWYNIIFDKNEVVHWGRFTNPNNKWDWWTIGGRYADRLITKSGEVTNSAKISELDFSKMKSAKIKERKKWIEETFKELNKNGITREQALKIWSNICADEDKTYNEWKKYWDESKDKKITFYDYVAALDDSNPIKIGIKTGVYSAFADNMFGLGLKSKNKDVFAWAEEVPFLTTYAMVKDGKWYEKGEMGWFGVSFNEMDEDEWRKSVIDAINSADPECFVTVVDCNI